MTTVSLYLHLSSHTRSLVDTIHRCHTGVEFADASNFPGSCSIKDRELQLQELVLEAVKSV